MRLEKIVDLIAVNWSRYIVPEEWDCIPLYEPDESTLVVVAHKGISEEVIDDLRFMYSKKHILIEAVEDIETFDRITAFYISRYGQKGNGSGNYGVIECPVEFASKCPLDWHELKQTENLWSRHCSVCDRNVIMCGNNAQVEAAKKVGACVAIARNDDERVYYELGGLG